MEDTTLKTLRQARHLTQKALALRSGVTQGTISALERGRRMGSLKVYDRLARALDVSLADFFAPLTKALISPSLTLADLLEPAAPMTELPVGNWSPTRLADWLLCPAKGAWSTGVFELPPDFRFPHNDAAIRGKATHAYAEARLTGASVNDALIRAADTAIDVDPDLWRPFTEAWEGLIRPSLGVPQAMEQRLEVSIGGHTVTVVIDVVDAVGAIRDLKTTSRTPNPTNTARESLQGPLYVAAWREQTGETAPFVLDYLVGRKDRVVAVQVPVPVTQADIDRVTRQLDWAAELAANPDRIVANPMNKYGCSSCAFLTVCAERFGTLIDAPVETVAAS